MSINIQKASQLEDVKSSVDTSKMIRDTYRLLSMSLVFSAVMAVISMVINPPVFVHFVCVITAFVCTFILNRKQDTEAALPILFIITGALGFGLGPILNHYMAMASGGQIIATSFMMTAVIFTGLSAYVMNTKKDFSFMGGFLAVGLGVMLLSMIVLIGMSLFGFYMPALHLAFSAMVVVLMSGVILYDTSNIINGHYQNYVIAAAGLFLTIYNLFISLLHLIGALRD